jgi:eukaryotic-like serine/threonine-protein kinase
VLVAGAAVAALSNDETPKTPPATTLAGSDKCVVSYAVWSQSNNKFKAAVTIANRDTLAVKDWKLWFVMPGDQVVSGNGKLKLSQQGRAVTVQSKTALGPQQTQTLEFTGRYQASNAAPMAFDLGGQKCQVYVSPAPGAPSQPVEVLDNGQIQLGPPATKDTPIPGISINPSGVAVPVPVGTTPVPGTTTSTTPVIIDNPGGGGEDDDEDPPIDPSVPVFSTKPTTTEPTSASPSASQDTYTDPADAPGDGGGGDGSGGDDGGGDIGPPPPIP